MPNAVGDPGRGQSAMAAVVRAIAGALPESAPAEEKPTRRRWLAAGFSMSVRGTGYLDAYPRGVVVLSGWRALALAAFFVVDGITSLISRDGFLRPHLDGSGGRCSCSQACGSWCDT